MKNRMTVLVILAAVTVGAAPLGTEFTYQGVLSNAGTPASGDFDFRFLLYDAAVGGSQVGGILYVDDLAVSDGRMTTQLDFGSIFDGTALWLEVGVRDGGSTGVYTVLSPRQELTAAPFAQHSQTADTAATAGHATTAGDAANLGGYAGSYYLTWSNFIGVPGDLLNGDDDTLADLNCSPDEITRWNGTAWNCSGDDDTPFVRTSVVGPVGTSTQNGTALRNAVNAITPPTIQEEAVLLVLEPGTYDVGTTALPIWAWMTIEGAGEDLTVITGAVCDSILENGTVASTSDHVGLRRLTVGNTCAVATDYATAFHSGGDFAVAEHAAFKVEGGAGFSTAVHSSGADLRMDHITANAGNGQYSVAAVRNFGAGFTLRHSTLRAHHGAGGCMAFRNTGGDDFLLRDVTAETDPAWCSSSTGISSDDASGTLEDVRAEGAIAIDLRASLPETQVVILRDIDALGSDFGIVCGGTLGGMTLDIDHSRISGSSIAIVNTGGCSINASGSYLEPTVLGSATCIGVYDGSTFYPNTCP